MTFVVIFLVTTRVSHYMYEK